jgi:hypothetical protein
MSERTFIGLDVHARPVRAAVLDGLTGEVSKPAGRSNGHVRHRHPAGGIHRRRIDGLRPY